LLPEEMHVDSGSGIELDQLPVGAAKPYRGRVEITTFISGLLFSLSLIVAIGPQNAFVLQQGARREHVTIVVLVCTASDGLLIAAGVAGIGSVVGAGPGALTVTRFGGAALLLAYGCLGRALADAAASPPQRLATPRRICRRRFGDHRCANAARMSAAKRAAQLPSVVQ
jgi:hypothetical protein